MTRTMADAISANYGSLPPLADAIRAGYVTGSPDIQWTAAQLATATVTIDQGFTGSPVASATVRDVEAGAWTPVAAVNLTGWTAARPTIYCNQNTLPSVLAAGWRGDLWLAIITPQPPGSPPVVPGCTVVAIQYAQAVGAAYDLSVVFDDTWPNGDPMALVMAQSGWGTCQKCGALWATFTTSGNVCPAGGQHVTPADWQNLAVLTADLP